MLCWVSVSWHNYYLVNLYTNVVFITNIFWWGWINTDKSWDNIIKSEWGMSMTRVTYRGILLMLCLKFCQVRHIWIFTDGLAKDCHYSTANVLELMHVLHKLSIWHRRVWMFWGAEQVTTAGINNNTCVTCTISWFIAMDFTSRYRWVYARKT